MSAGDWWPGRRPWVFGFLLLALLAATARFVHSAFVLELFEPVWLGEVMSPLIEFILGGTPITLDSLANRSYGVVAYAVMDPVLRLWGRDATAIGVWTTLLALASLVGAYLLLARLYFPKQRTAQLLMAIAWISFAPLIYSFSMRHIDLWELFLLAVSLTLLLGPGRRWSGVPLAAAFLAKLLPAVVLAYVFLRERGARVASLATVALLLLLGQLLYGPALGLQYPWFLATTAGDTAYQYSFHHENNSLRGMVFKLAAGFEMQPNSAEIVHPPHPHLLNLLVQFLSLLLLGYLAFVSWRGRNDSRLERRSIEFALAVTTMMLVAPHLALEHIVPMLLVFSILAWHAATHRSAWSRTQVGVMLTAAVLIGCFVPLSLLARALFVPTLMRWTGNEDALFFGPTIGSYALLCFAGLGILLTWGILARIEFRMHRAANSGATSSGPHEAI